MSEAGNAAPRGGPFGLLRRVDDAVFVVEQTIVASFLSAMTIMVFLDVVYRRLIAPDSKLGQILARLFSVEDEAARASLDSTASVLSGVLGVLAVWFAFWSAGNRGGEKPGPGKPLVLALVTSAVAGGLGWLMVQPWMPSRYFYLILFGLFTAGVVAHGVRTKAPGFAQRIVGVLVAGAVLAWFALSYFPEGYSWSQEVSLLMLMWVGFLGASICAHEGKHIRMEALQRLVPEGARKVVLGVGFLFTAAFTAFLGVLGYQYTFDETAGAIALGGVFEQTGIPDWLAIVAVPIAFGLATIRFVASAVSVFLGGDYGTPISEEDEARAAAQEAAAATHAEEGGR